MSTTDARSIGQVLYEALNKGRRPWAGLFAEERDHWERAAEPLFNRGFKTGIEAQKLADPPPVAKQLKKQLGELAAAARAHIDAQRADHVGTRVQAREHLEKLPGAVK